MPTPTPPSISPTPNLPGPEFPENEVVGGLLETSSQFKSFYQDVRGNITQTIRWVLDKDLKDTAYTRFVFDQEGRVIPLYIVLPRIPPNPEDDFIVAHELAAFLVVNEGYPLAYTLKPEPSLHNLCTMLNDIFLTPLRDSMLERYGFDLERNYSSYTKLFYRQNVNFSCKPEIPGIFDSNTLSMAFAYAKYTIYWEQLLHEAGTRDIEFKSWYEEYCPSALNDGEELFKMIQDIGWDKPNDVKRFLDWVIWVKYQLNDYIDIYTPNVAP